MTSERRLSISNLISRFRSKKRTTDASRMSKTATSNLSRDSRPPLATSPLPFVLPEHQHTLSTLGWTTLSFPSSARQDAPTNDAAITAPPGPHLPTTFPLQQAYEQLLSASQAFFAQADGEKQRWKHTLRSEEGWSKIPGEKEFITLRTLDYCPELLRQPAKRYWDLMGAHLSTTLGRISTTLHLPDEESGGLRKFVGPCGSMQAADARKTATMLRLFRYETWEAKEVAEPHADLGLLSVVVGDVPGLEVWDGRAWFACEKERGESGQHGATMLAGRQLERLSNGRYPAGGHRVVSYGLPTPKTDVSSSVEEKHYRFSIVFVLRAHEPVMINSSDLETEITGTWSEPMHGIDAGTLYAQIRGRHFNINIDPEEREKQRQKVRKEKVDKQAGSGHIVA